MALFSVVKFSPTNKKSGLPRTLSCERARWHVQIGPQSDCQVNNTPPPLPEQTIFRTEFWDSVLSRESAQHAPAPRACRTHARTDHANRRAPALLSPRCPRALRPVLG